MRIPPGTAISSGTTLELVPGKRIVQSWRTTEFAASDADSTIIIELEPTKTVTRLTLIHKGAPSDQTEYEHGGWEDFYFVPMKAYFARQKPIATTRKAVS